MFVLLVPIFFVAFGQAAARDISGTNPAAGSCICVSFAGVNVRDGPCGTVIGSADPPQCYKAVGSQRVNCPVNGVNYDFFEVDYGGRSGWMAGNYLVMGSDSQCGGGNPPGNGNCDNVEKVYRAEWNARPPNYNINSLPNKPVGMGFVHHTVTPFCYNKDDCMAQMRSIQNYHMDSNGWPDIGYNWLVGEDGRAYEGRQWDKVGAHTYGYNDVAVAVSVIGDFTSRPPNQAALDALNNIYDCAIDQGVLSSNYEMFGHRDGGCTACPGDQLYATIRSWPQYSMRDIPNYCRNDGTDD